MGGMGPAPEDAARRRNKERFDELPADGHKGSVPKLPKDYRTSERKVTYLKATRQWYETWACSPMATQFAAVDWQRLQRVARVVDQYERDPDPKLIAEIRLQEAAFGGSPLDRKRLGVKITGPKPAQDDPGDGGRSRKRTRGSSRRTRLSVVAS